MPTAHIVSLPTATARLVGWAELTAQRPFLVHYAARRLAGPLLAEDLVRDVLEAVMTGRARFEGRSSLRSWLVAVPKHKIVDLIRSRSGHVSLDAFGDGDDETPAFDSESDQPDPDEVATQRQRLRQTPAGLAALPDGLRRVVEPRVFEERSTDEVPVAATVYFDDIYVERPLAEDTARRVRGLQALITNEYAHNGLRADDERIVGRLLGMVRGRA